MAHDFVNNLLTVINGYSNLRFSPSPNVADTETMRNRLSQIRAAGEREAELTQQLAFGRKQISQPHLFNLNSLIVETQPMLRQ